MDTVGGRRLSNFMCVSGVVSRVYGFCYEPTSLRL